MVILRCIEDKSVPLALDVVIFWLFSYIQTVKLQFTGQLLLSLKDDQRNLDKYKHSVSSLY